jgi:hypothetical protein
MGSIVARKVTVFSSLSGCTVHAGSGHDAPDDVQSYAHRVSLLVERRAQGAACQRKKGLTG